MADRNQPRNMSVLEHNTYKIKGASPDIHVHCQDHTHSAHNCSHTHHTHTLIREKCAAQHCSAQSSGAKCVGYILSGVSGSRQVLVRHAAADSPAWPICWLLDALARCRSMQPCASNIRTYLVGVVPHRSPQIPGHRFLGRRCMPSARHCPALVAYPHTTCTRQARRLSAAGAQQHCMHVLQAQKQPQTDVSTSCTLSRHSGCKGAQPCPSSSSSQAIWTRHNPTAMHQHFQ